eukprot:g12166.t1
MAVSRRVNLSLVLAGMVSTRAVTLSAFPKYCSKEMEATSIPPLNDSVAASFGGQVSITDVELLQVHAIIRHGARGPYIKPRCWEGYDMRWDCNVTEVVSPTLSVDEGVAEAGLFRKRYDAYPEDNALGGTCMEGQLLDEGYLQEQANGRHLKDAYLCGAPSCLAAADATAKDLQEEGALYLRSDDQQRTVMSGQILTASMLDISGAVLDWHTGDDKYDYLAPNVDQCPRLAELSEEAFADSTWTDFTDGFLMKALNDSMTNVWEEDVVWWDVLDCLMTTACTGRELPEEMTEDLFEGAISYSTQQYVHEASFNDAAYGKLAMAKLTLEIRERVVGAMNGTSPLKFVLLSGHDTTFIPFLAAVATDAWDQQWPRYASLATIELLRVAVGNGTENAREGDGDGGDAAVEVGGEYFFRFVYNGEVLKLEGCDQDICPIDAFLNATQFSVDLQDSSHCCCRNMTQAEVDEDENRKDNDGPVSVSPAPVTANSTGAVAGDDPSGAGSGLAAGPIADADDGNDSQAAAAAAAGGAMGIAFACFVIGAIFGGVPALMYFRRFRYEQMRGGGHSYEMT